MVSDEIKEMRRQYFKEFLNFFWLRPENALLCALRAEKYYSTTKYFGNGKNTVDVSCGDGVFSFITLGGKLTSNTDMFRSIKTEETFRKGNYDAFDFFDEKEYKIEVKKPADKSYEIGTDWKDNLLKKAEKINFYKKLIQHDNNNPLPFEDSSMKYVFSNATYWVKNFKEHLQDLARVTESGGHIVLEMKVDRIKEYTSRNYLEYMGPKFHEIIDAGRLSTWEGLRSKKEIIDILENIKGCKIKTVDPMYGDRLAKIWDIGLRPLFNPLVKMANNLNDEKRINVKEEWNEIMYNLLEHFLVTYEAKDETAIEYLIVLEKL